MSSSRTDSHVLSFYASGGGDRMFSPAHSTAAVSDYLAREETFVMRVFQEHSPRHLFEVGCGHGTYLTWAEKQGVDYDGVDLVSHLVEAGRRRLTGSARTRQKLHVGSGREVAHLFEAEGLMDHASDIVALFPFNCFGNVAEPERVVKSLTSTGARVLISSFIATEEATTKRREYYVKSGFTGLRDVRDGLGVLFTSEEGLHSYAYELSALEKLFGGHRLARREALGPIAQGLLFEALR
jgi:SAM-dependent methyltransferase